MKLKLMINCNEAGHYCDKAQYAEANTWERFLMRMHQRMCKLCRDHSVKNTKLSKVIEDAQLKTLSSSEKNRMKDQLSKENNT